MADDDTTRPTLGDGPRSGAGRHGEPVTGGGASFRCGACGEAAAVVRLLRAGELADMGPPLGEQRHQSDGLIIDYWLGSTCWMAVDQDTWTRIGSALKTAHPDPAALHAIGWEIAPFFCRACQTCYCRDHWNGVPVWDGPFYDYTEGHCPAGHRQLIDD
jgi:hypothetical protein